MSYAAVKPSDIQSFEALFWDFDGVLMNSNEIRDQGFVKVLAPYPESEVEKLLKFHRENGGLSRYVKFRYFFEEIRGEQITEEQIQHWADRFSSIMQNMLNDPDLLINETLELVKRYSAEVPMFIVSGSDQTELRKVCESHGIDRYFKRIHGSPTPKKQWVNTILKEEKLNPERCILIGDSINDYEAAFENNMHFMGYNNDALAEKSTAKFNFSN